MVVADGKSANESSVVISSQAEIIGKYFCIFPPNKEKVFSFLRNG